jgi:hypothetical protein
MNRALGVPPLGGQRAADRLKPELLTRPAPIRGGKARTKFGAHLPAVLFLLLALFLAEASRAGELGFRRQAIRVPTTAHFWQGWARSGFGDVDGDGRQDLLAVDSIENKLYVYRQRASGFVTNADQGIALPPHTAWVALGDVEAHPGLELLMSTATGLEYLRQNGGVFDSQPRTLIQANQQFANRATELVASVSKRKGGTNLVIPIISGGEAVLYERNDAYEWRSGERKALLPGKTSWNTAHGEWMMGSSASRSLSIRQRVRANPEDDPSAAVEGGNDTIQRLIKELEDTGSWSNHGVERVDVDGDGREDLVLWRLTGDLGMKTDLYLFRRGADGSFPAAPTQVLHCRGFPVQLGPRQHLSPVGDIDGDGRCELVLVTLKTAITSSSSVVEMFVSRGVDWTLTIRTYQAPGQARVSANPKVVRSAQDAANAAGFSKSADASLSLRSMLPVEQGPQGFFIVDGDFNGDGRLDVLVRRSATEWDLFPSSASGSWFDAKPAFTFEIPEEGELELLDLNRDGLSDLVQRPWEQASVLIFLSQPHPNQRRSP